MMQADLQATFSANLAHLRREKGLTQAKLSELIRVEGKALQHWEGGVCMPDYGTMTAIARFFFLTVDELLTSNQAEMEVRP